MRSENIKIYLVFGVVLISVLSAVFFLVSEVGKNSQGLLAQKQEFLSSEKKLSDLEGDRQKLEEHKKDLEKIDTLLVEHSSPTDFTDFLRGLTANPLGSIPYKEIKDKALLSFSVSFSGSFPDLLRFIDKIENGPYLSEITTLNVRGAGQNITATLEILTLSK